MITIFNFKKFIDELSLENSRNYKISIIEKYKEDESVKYFLHFLFNPYIVTGISKKKLSKDVGFQSGTLWLDYPEDSVIFEYLKEHNTGTDKDIWTVQKFKEVHISEACKELFDRLIIKDLPLGIEAKTINKVISGLIPTFNVQLAEKYFEHQEFVEGKTFVITTKIDGMRCIMMKENGNVTFWSRQGQPIEGLVDLEKEAKEVFPDNVVMDGELVAKETSKEDTYKNTIKTARTKDIEKHNLKMMVFDYMPVEDFKNQSCNLDYTDRQVVLDSIFDFKTLSYFTKLPLLYVGSDISKIEEILQQQVAHKEEGIMINIAEATYEFKRTKNLLKVKKFQDTEVKVIGFEPGINKLSNTLGNLICEYKDNKLGVGSGFTDEERDYIWNHQDEYLNKYIKVKYFEETTNANGSVSLRFPIYLGIRLDEDK